jgi:hypothetical protein
MPPHPEEQAYPNGQFVPQGSVVHPPVPSPVPQPQDGGASGYVSGAGDEQYSHPGWSWAGFFWFFPFIIAIRNYKLLFLGLLPMGILFFAFTLGGVLFVDQMDSESSGMWLALLLPIIIGICALFFIGLSFHLGFKGRVLASVSRTFSNKEQYIGFMKAIDHGAMVAFFAMLASWVLGVLASVLFAGFGILSDVDEVSLGAQTFEAIQQVRNLISL